jgi:hypothetical protein
LGTYNIIQFVSNDLNSWDTVSATISLTVGINEDQKPNLTIYPNPTQTDIFIQNYDSEPMNVTIFNIQGLIINEIQIPAKRTHKLSVVEYLPGVYFLKYRNTKGVATKMFSKIR